jgi:hypothetical protein
LYWWYRDFENPAAGDDDIAAFVNAYNQITQTYINWFNQINLPYYPGPLIADGLLDWVAQGVYGILRPLLPTGKNQFTGDYDTWAYATQPYGVARRVGSPNFYVTNDDIFKRIITWHFYKGDGKIFNIRWLKRRIMRFLNGANGTNGDASATYQISVTFGVGNQVNIRILEGIRTLVSGALYNRFGFNTRTYNGITTSFMRLANLAQAPVLKSAIDAMVTELPFQFVYIVTIT